MTLLLPLIAVTSILFYIAYTFLIYPLFISPLRRIPAPSPLCRVTSVWILWKRYRKQENRALLAAHKTLGPVVLLGPKEVSVNCIKGGLSTVYAGGMEKGEWYEVFENYG
jgi:hypothetical protein